MPRWLIVSSLVFRRIVGWGALALLCLFLIALVINARDEPLSPEAQAMLQLPPNSYQPEENIYVALAGLNAPAGQSIIAVGQAKIAQYNSRVDAMLSDPVSGVRPTRSTDPAALVFIGKVDLGSSRESAFWAAARENGAKIDYLIAQNRELYERYLALQQLPGYFETERPTVLSDIFAPPTELRHLFLAKCSLDIQKGDETQKQAALTSLRRDIEVWHRMLRGEGNLISKMLAVAYLQNDYLLLSDMVADPSTSIPANIDSFLPDLDLTEWNIGKVFASEFRFHSFFYRQTQELYTSGWQSPQTPDSPFGNWFARAVLNPIAKVFFKPNATENLDARLMNQLSEFAAINPTSFTAQRARFKQWESENADFVKLQTIYNPIGKILVAVGAPAYENYPLRPYDAAALQRLVQLSLEIRRRQIAPASIPEFIRLHPEWSTHPADGRSFSWIPNTNEIAIHTVAKQSSDRRFSVQVWRNSTG